MCLMCHKSSWRQKAKGIHRENIRTGRKKKKRENKPNKSKLKKNLEISKRQSNKWDQEHRFENCGIIKKYGLNTH